MATLKATFSAWTHSGLMFWILWMVASFAGAILYFLPVGVVHILLGLGDSGGPEFPAQFSTGMRALAAILCGAACGSTIGLAHWLLLRTRLQRAGGWVAATIMGYASLGLWPVLANLVQPGWMDWAFTLIVNGKMFWLARELAEWPASSWLPGVVTYVMFGVALGIAQWLTLRGRVDDAGWWIAISTVGWALAAVLWIIPSEPSPSLTLDLAIVMTIAPLLPYALAGAGMAWLLRRSAPVVRASA